MAKIALIGASGNAGSRILKELYNRGHDISAIVRHPEKIAACDRVHPVRADANDPQSLTEVLRGHDAVISSLMFTSSDPHILISAVRAAGVKHYLVVGGAGSLEVSPGQRLIDQPEFPDIYKAEASKGAEFLTILKKVEDLDWTFLSPSALFVAGERTGIFRLGKDALLTHEKGSSISFEDYAVALADELEKPAHIRQRFTVGY